MKSTAEAAPANRRAALVAKLGASWRSHAESSTCKVTYKNSVGGSVVLTIDQVMARIYDLSFDPYHCPEMRWGAYSGVPAEMQTCSNDDATHLARFDVQRRNRNVIDRQTTATTGPDYGPNVPEDIDVVKLLAALGFQ